MSSIADIRRDYQLETLSESDVRENPFDQFTLWWVEALNAAIDEVNAMTLSTVTNKGLPASRIVLLKGYDRDGFVFFTNYQSDKGLEMKENPNASLLFFWKELERQVRINGKVEQVSAAESDEYFYSRPIGSRIGAWASAQSTVIPNREMLEIKLKELTEQFADGHVPRPPHWGGYRVIPESIEFWQGRSSRLHDRIRYRLEGEIWVIERLSP